MTLKEKFPIGTRVVMNDNYYVKSHRNRLYGFVDSFAETGTGFAIISPTSPTPKEIMDEILSMPLYVKEREMTIINPVEKVDKEYEALYV